MKHNVIASHKVIGTIISIIVFIILFKYLAVQIGDTTENATLAPAWLSLVTAIFGPISGAVTALLVMRQVTRWLIVQRQLCGGLGRLPIVYLVFIGLITRRLAIFIGELTTRKLVLFNIWQLLANIVVWLIIAPLGDHWVYNLSLVESMKEGAHRLGQHISCNYWDNAI